MYNFFDRIFLPFRPPKTKKSAIAHWKSVIKQRKKLLKSELGRKSACIPFLYCSLFFFTPLFRSYTERMFISCCLESKWYLLSIGKRYNYVPTTWTVKFVLSLILICTNLKFGVFNTEINKKKVDITSWTSRRYEHSKTSIIAIIEFNRKWILIWNLREQSQRTASKKCGPGVILQGRLLWLSEDRAVERRWKKKLTFWQKWLVVRSIAYFLRHIMDDGEVSTPTSSVKLGFFFFRVGSKVIHTK